MDRFTDSFLSEVSPDKALQHRLRAEVILGRSLLSKHLGGQHDQSSHGSWATGGEYTSSNYRMSHRPPDPEDGAPAHDLTGGGLIYPDNVYDPDGARIYGGGDTAMGQRVQNVLRSIRGNPDAKIQIYRAVPKGVNRVNAGDWVSVDLGYAEQHGVSNLNNDYDILSNTVSADEIYNDGNSLYEWSYHPRVRKHLAGQHDQSTHGSWAGGEGSLLFPKDKLIADWQSKSVNETFDKSGSEALRLSYKHYGVDANKPTVSDEEFEKLQAQGAVIVYRGLSRETEDGMSPQAMSEQFRTGDTHFAGYGYDGNGTYSSTKLYTAQEYASRWDETGLNGTVIEMAIKPNAKFISLDDLEDIYHGEIEKNPKFTSLQKLWLSSVSNLALHNGYDGYITTENYYVILDRSALVLKTKDIG